MTANSHITWVVVADTTRCRIYEHKKNPEELNLIKDLEHPQNKLKDFDLTADKPGRYKANSAGQGSYAAHGTYEQRTDPKEIKIADFARDISKELDYGRNVHAYAKIIIITPSHMSGLLFHHFNKHVKGLVTHNIEKNVLHLNDQDLLKFIYNHTRYVS